MSIKKIDKKQFLTIAVAVLAVLVIVPLLGTLAFLANDSPDAENPDGILPPTIDGDSCVHMVCLDDDENACDRCGKVFTCEHDELSTQKACVQISSVYHREQSACRACGNSVYSIVKHSFKDSVCSVCGYPCTSHTYGDDLRCTVCDALPSHVLLSDGESAWYMGNVNTTVNEDGSGCIAETYTGTLNTGYSWTFKYLADTPVDASSYTHVAFSLYVSNADAVNGSSFTFEVSSSRSDDKCEVQFSGNKLQGLTDGWNRIVIPLSTFNNYTGDYDPTAFIRFRIYGTGAVDAGDGLIVGIDDLLFVNAQ